MKHLLVIECKMPILFLIYPIYTFTGITAPFTIYTRTHDTLSTTAFVAKINRVLRRQSRDTNRNMKRSVHCQYGQYRLTSRASRQSVALDSRCREFDSHRRPWSCIFRNWSRLSLRNLTHQSQNIHIVYLYQLSSVRLVQIDLSSHSSAHIQIAFDLDRSQIDLTYQCQRCLSEDMAPQCSIYSSVIINKNTSMHAVSEGKPLSYVLLVPINFIVYLSLMFISLLSSLLAT